MIDKKAKFLIGIIFIMMLNVGVFCLIEEINTTFWISWVFIHVAFLIALFVNVFCLPKENWTAIYSISAISIGYFLLEVAVAIGFIFLFPEKKLSAFLIQFIMLGLFGIIYLATGSMYQNIEQSQERSKEDLSQYKYIIEAMRDATFLMDYNAPYKKTVEHAFDALQASQVRSSLDVKPLEDSMLTAISALKISIKEDDEQGINEICKDIEKMVLNRENRLKLQQ